MKLRHSRFLGLTAGAALLATIAVSLVVISAAWSQSARTIRIVVPYPPGGGADVLARVVVNEIGNMHGPTAASFVTRTSRRSRAY